MAHSECRHVCCTTGSLLHHHHLCYYRPGKPGSESPQGHQSGASIAPFLGNTPSSVPLMRFFPVITFFSVDSGLAFSGVTMAVGTWLSNLSSRASSYCAEMDVHGFGYSTDLRGFFLFLFLFFSPYLHLRCRYVKARSSK
ncbi:hypothetical protein VTJ83DRAFT_7584 [Remersonia thermophila]|uniref:Uncharacterized protein n=1 Tax=Remersonia thermophila TaxID=72144 RepID=A0ABR4D3X0_9PEZI